LTRAERRAAIDGFSSRHGSILLATDAAGEGLNLQSRCRVVVNLELPWNPMRLEQRIGRVDRIGQRRTVHAIHLIAGDTGEVRILQRLQARLAQAQTDLGAPDSLGITTGSSRSEEDTTSRLVVGYGAPGAVATDVPSGPIAALSFVRCTREAAIEHARLTRQRAVEQARNITKVTNVASIAGVTGVSGIAGIAGVARGDDEAAAAAPSVSGALLARTRRRTLRALLGPRTLALMQTVCEDAAGRTVAAHLTPLLVPSRFGRTLRELVDAIEAAPLDELDPVVADWRDRTQRIHRAFWSRRLTNERAIGRLLLEGGADLFQPGLFDRRAIRGRLLMAHDERILEEDTARRIRVVEAAAAASFGRARAVLILTTRRRA
jgi:hypothetical protein